MTNRNLTLNMPQYFLDKNTGVYFSESKPDFNYSDGDAVEDALLSIILSAKDIKVGSPDLTQHITDWPSRYHLSPQRVDLLRPLQDILKGDILEIGSGCGAITRYLGELGGNIIAIEGSAKRAQITVARCRDLSNVKVYCENFNDFIPNNKYDVITLIGVFEYSPMFIKGEFPPQIMLEKIKSFLKPNGVLIIAIENQLGLKYFAGAPEDHLGIPFAGIENKYNKGGPITFGKKVLENYLKNAGLNQIDFLYPFPDYKFPAAIITESGCNDENINIPDILRCKIKYFQHTAYSSSFDEEKAITTISENQLVEALSNSFLVIAGSNGIENIDPNIRAYTYSNHRKREFCKQNKIIKQKKDYLVLKEKIYPQIHSKSILINHVLTDEKYIEGNLYVNSLRHILSNKEWSCNDILAWAKPWIELLSTKSHKKDDDNMPLLLGKYFDAAPFNIIISKNNNEPYKLFDLEWETKNILRLDYIIFRSIYYSITSIASISKSTKICFDYISEIVIEILRLYFTDGEHKNLTYYKEIERIILKEIFDVIPENIFENKLLYNFFIDEQEQNNSIDPNRVSNLIQSISNTKIQIYWADRDCVFSENKSDFKSIQLEHYSKNLTFKINTLNENVEFIKFDIGNASGFLNIDNIKVQNINGNHIWKWNAADIKIKNDCLLIENGIHLNNKTIQLSTSNDPYFVIQLSSDLFPLTNTELLVEISLSSLNDYQSELLNTKMLTPLSFISEQELILFNSKNKEMEEKNNKLQEYITIINNNIESLKNENENLSNLISKHLILSKEYENYKNVLSDEIATKTDKINILFLEKEQLTLKNSELEFDLDAIKTEIVKLKQENTLLVQAKEFAEIQLENNINLIEEYKLLLKNSEKQSVLTINELRQNEHFLKNIIDNNYIDLKEKKEFIRNSSEKLKRVYSELEAKNECVSEQNIEINILSEKNFSLAQEIDSTKELLKELLDKKTENENYIINIEKKHFEYYQDQEKNNSELFSLLQNKLENYKTSIKWYQNTYENRSILGITKDRILKKLMLKK